MYFNVGHHLVALLPDDFVGDVDRLIYKSDYVNLS